MHEDHLLENVKDGVLWLTLNRKKQKNALNTALMSDLVARLNASERDPSIKCAIIYGGPDVFSVGADVGEMKELSTQEAYRSNFLHHWDKVANYRKPLVAFVCGYALGGGLELALACDFIICDSTARFGQPEIKLGLMPGAGGTQRLSASIGASRALFLCLSAHIIDAQQAQAWGLVAHVIPHETSHQETSRQTKSYSASFVDNMARAIAAAPHDAVLSIKDAIKTPLDSKESLAFERHLFYSLLNTPNAKEGISAFLDKRAPHFSNEP